MSELKLGVRWPEYDLGLEPKVIRTFVEAAEELGFDHITISDFVLVPEVGDEKGSIALKREEALSMLACMAGMSTNLGYMPTVLTLPKRQALLVAEMSATIDRLCGGRFRLGVGVGSHETEYRLLGADFASRGKRFEEQVEILRRLWQGAAEPFEGEWTHLPPVTLFGEGGSRRIPIWIAAGDHSPPSVVRRIGRLADGVIPPWDPTDVARDYIAAIRDAARAAGRDPAAIGIEPKIALRKGKHLRWRVGDRKTDDELAAEITAWLGLGATHLELKTRRSGLKSVDEHIDAMKHFRQIVETCS